MLKINDKVYVRHDAPLSKSDTVFTSLLSTIEEVNGEELTLRLYTRKLTINSKYCISVDDSDALFKVFIDDLRRFLQASRVELASDLYVRFNDENITRKVTL